MGLVINPTAFRIGHVKAWTDAWYLHRMHYPVFVHKSLEIKILLQYILLYKYPSQWSNWIYSHTTYYYFNNKFYINLFVYDSNDPHNYYNSARDHKYGWFKKSKFKRFWTKKQLLDLQFLYQRWFLLCQVMNLDFEELELDSLKWRIKRRSLNKIYGLRKKYGPSWVAREELFIWKFPISTTSEDSYNKMGITILNLLYKLYIMPKLRLAFRSPNFDLVETANNVLKSHKILYFFFSYIDKILKVIPTYPVGLFNRLTYKAVYRFFRMYFIFKPYWINLCKLYELVLLHINVNSKIRIYLLDNIHLNATYIARYIMTCLRLNFDYRDTMIPIKKTLLKIINSKRWRPIRDFKKKNWQIYLQRYKSLLNDRIKFHLVNNDMLKMFMYRISYISRIKKRFIKPIYIRFISLNYISLKKNFCFIKKFLNINFSKLNKNFYLNSVNKNFNLKKFLKKKNIYIFFKNRKNMKNKALKSFSKERGYLIYWKKRYFSIMKLFLLKLKKYMYLKDLINSFLNLQLFLFPNILIHDIKRNFMEKLKRLNIKTIIWLRKRKRLKRRSRLVLKSKYRRKYRTKLKVRFDLLKYRMRWRFAKKLYRETKKFYLSIKKKYWCYKNLYIRKDEIHLVERSKKKKIFIFFFNFKLYNLKFNIFTNYKPLLLSLFSITKIFIYDKKFKKDFINFFSKINIIRGYNNLFFFNYLTKYCNRYKPFIFKIDLYRNYIKNVLNLPDVDAQFIAKKPKKYDLEEMPLKDKFKRLRILEGGSRSLLYGYKFHFVGRFTRKQKAASLWFAKGANSVSSMRVDIDYGFHTIALRYSACTLKVWLYRNRGFSFKYGYRLV